MALRPVTVMYVRVIVQGFLWAVHQAWMNQNSHNKLDTANSASHSMISVHYG